MDQLTQQQRDGHLMTRVTVIGAIVDGLLGVAKIAVGWVSHSHALIADGVHSLSDLGTDIFVVLAAKWSREAPDSNHPYGHDRIETLATLGLGVVLLVVAGGLLFDGVQRLVDDTVEVFLGPLAFAVAVVSIAAKEGLFHYTRHYAKQLNSKLLEANAWHARSDSLSSIAVLVGLVGVAFDQVWLDAAAALVVAVLIAKIAVELLWESMAELIDTALPDDEVEAMRAAAMGVPGLRDIHHIRTRTMGGKTLLDMHLQVNPKISVSEGHEIGCWVAATLRAKFPDVTDITFHVDPEDDAAMDQDLPPSLRPLRDEIEAELTSLWSDRCAIDQLNLHYLRGRVDVDLVTSTPVTETHLSAVETPPWLGRIRIFRPVDAEPEPNLSPHDQGMSLS
jgi:cation diffusion facilitator family transporter